MNKTNGHLALLASLFIAGCGGSSSGLVSTTTAFEGKVIDGYIKNAKVCLDLNGNLKCDDGPGEEEEAYTVLSGDGGSYSFEYTGTRDISTLHIIAEAGADSIDEDDGGKTFAEAGRSAVSLLTPAPAPEAITPLTTMVSTQQIIAKEEGKQLTVSEAESMAKVALNLPAEAKLVSLDYKGGEGANTDTANLAKAMTYALAESQRTIKENDDFQTAVTASQKSAAAEAIKEAVKTVQVEVTKNITSDGKLKAGVTADTLSAATKQVISGRIQDIVNTAAAPKSQLWDDPVGYLAKGMYFLSFDNNIWFGDGGTPERAVRNENPAPRFSGVKAIPGKKQFNDANEWGVPDGATAYSETYQWPDNYYLIQGKGWTQLSDLGGTYTVDGNCFSITNESRGVEEACGKVMPMAGKTVKEAGFCGSETVPYFPSCVTPDLKFGDDAFANSFSLRSFNDVYRLWGIDSGPDVTYEYTQIGTTITVTIKSKDGSNKDGWVDVDSTIILDFISGEATDGAYTVIEAQSDANGQTFKVTAKESKSTVGQAVRYWGGWDNWRFLPEAPSLKAFVEGRIERDEAIDINDCSVWGKFAPSQTISGGYTVNWAKGIRDGNNCVEDTATEAQIYKQTTDLIFETVMGAQIMRSVAPDIYKKESDQYYGIELLWSVAKNKAGVAGVYNGEIERSNVKRVIESGSRMAVGNRPFVETINSAWGQPALPTDAQLFKAP